MEIGWKCGVGFEMEKNMKTKKGAIGVAVLLIATLCGAKTSADPVNAATVQPQTYNTNPQTPPPPIVQNAGDSPSQGTPTVCGGC